ncbi:MAG: hypothetical protein JJ992_21670, partial [Planctomycetes bacterium]|nr:hypothetical protein [Planctomycetota bacterium]
DGVAAISGADHPSSSLQIAAAFSDSTLPSPSTMAEVFNRNGYRLRAVRKAKPKKSHGNRRHLPTSLSCRLQGGAPRTGTLRSPL